MKNVMGELWPKIVPVRLGKKDFMMMLLNKCQKYLTDDSEKTRNYPVATVIIQEIIPIEKATIIAIPSDQL